MWSATSGRYTEIQGNPEDITESIIPKWDNSYWLEENNTQSGIEFNSPRETTIDDRLKEFQDEFKPLPDDQIPF